MRKDEFSARLRQQMSPARVSPQLRRQALCAARGKERKTVKKKLSMALVFALLGVLACSVALAAAMNRAGMFDFISRYSSTYSPEDAADLVQTKEHVMETDEATITVREVYYDGRTARVTVDATPKDEKTLLMGVDSWIGDPWQDLITLVWTDADESDTRSIAEAFADYGYERAYSVSLNCEEKATGQIVGGSCDFVLGGDGVLTTFEEWDFDDDQSERLIVMSVTMRVYEAGEDGMPMGTDETRRYELPMTLTASVRAGEEGVAQAYVNEEPVLYESIGVRVDRLLIEVKPLELYATVDYTVVDEDLYAATDDGLWFEFVDETIEADEAWQQRLDSGLTGGGGIGPIGKGHYRMTETLGLNALRDVYTLRAFSAWEKVRYEAHDIAMRPATEEDIAHMQAEVLSEEEPDTLIDEMAQDQENGNG